MQWNLPKNKSSLKKKSPTVNKVLALKIREVDSLRKELELEREKVKDYINRLMYLQADFENYRKRVNKDLDETIQYGSQRLIVKLLPVVDELEYAIKLGNNSNGDKSFLEGIEMVLKKIYEILEKEGLSKIDSIGKLFDTSRHEAAEKVVTEEYEEGIIVEEIRKGFMYKDRVIRHSLVKVAISNVK